MVHCSSHTLRLMRSRLNIIIQVDDTAISFITYATKKWKIPYIFCCPFLNTFHSHDEDDGLRSPHQRYKTKLRTDKS